MTAVHVRCVGLAALAVCMASCAAKGPPPLPAALKFPDFMYPTTPQNARAAETTGIDRGWRYLQSDDLDAAQREFGALLKRNARFHPALTGAAYVSLARRNYAGALSEFDTALRQASAYVPALVGRGQALLGLDREADAIAAFEVALTVDPSLTDVHRRIEVLRFRGVQDVIERARSAARAGRLDEARNAYRRALEVSPDTAFLHRELAVVERRRNDLASALAELRRAVDLDPADAAAFVELGEILEQQSNFDEAEKAYRKAIDLEPSDELSRRVAALVERAREARLPPQYQVIPQTEQLTRGDLAALIGIRLDAVLRDAPTRQVVATDTRGHWANEWIGRVARTGIIEPFANHTFQPRARIRRADLATAVSRLLTLITAGRPQLWSDWTKNPPKVTDVTPGHLNYPAVSVAVASGVMPLVDGRFLVSRPVSGAEAVEVIDRVRVLAAAR